MKRFSLAALVMAIVGIVIMAISYSHSVGAAGPLKGSISIVGSTSVQPLAEELAKAFMKRNPKIAVTAAGGGSGAGIKAIRGGQADIGTSSRELKPEEKQGLGEVTIARDGIAVIVNPVNKVTGLTLAQVAKIYTDQIKDWRNVGGAKGSIVLIGREAGSGTRGAFEELVLGKAMPTPNMLVQGSTGAVRQTVAVTKNAIGYISMGQLDKTVKAVKINGVLSTEGNILNKSYALNRPFLFLTKGPAKVIVKAFIDFTLSPEGQTIVGKEFVPVGKHN